MRIRDFRDEVPEGFFDRNPPEMVDLLAVNHPYPFRSLDMPPTQDGVGVGEQRRCASPDGGARPVDDEG